MLRLAIPITGLGLLVASGVLYAIQTGHTRDPEIMAEAARRVRRAGAMELPGWTREGVEIAESQLRAAEAAGGISVRYRKQEERPSDGVNVMLLCGPHGPISVHPPTACFRGVGYRQLGEPRRERVKQADGTVLGTFWVTEFDHKENGIRSRIRTYWAWSPGGPWQAPENSRREFAGERVLYKLYLTEQVPPDGAGETGESAPQSQHLVEFARHYLTRLNQIVAPPEADQTERS